MTPKLQSLQITSSFLSLCSHIEHKALKKCSNFRAESLLLRPLAISFLGSWDGFSKSWPTTVFSLFALQVCCTWYVGMCLNNGYSLASIIFGFILFGCCVSVRIFLIAFLSLKCWLEDKLRQNLFITWAPNPSPLSVRCQKAKDYKSEYFLATTSCFEYFMCTEILFIYSYMSFTLKLCQWDRL